MIRLIPLALALLSVMGGGLLAWSRLADLPADHVFCRTGFCEPGPPTITSEPLNPFGWSDLAENKAAAGDIAGARADFARSVLLGPNIAPVLMRFVNFEVANGEVERTVPTLRHILELTAAYDNVIFRYLVRSRLPLDRILTDVIPDPGKGSAEGAAARAKAIAAHAALPEGDARPRGEAARGWVAYLIADRHPDAPKAYRELAGRGGITPELRNQWIEYLVAVRKEYQIALDAWAEAHAEEGYPARNRIFNPRFERARPSGRMDWAISRHDHATARAGGGSRRLRRPMGLRRTSGRSSGSPMWPMRGGWMSPRPWRRSGWRWSSRSRPVGAGSRSRCNAGSPRSSTTRSPGPSG